MFSIPLHSLALRLIASSFRPLSGIMFSIKQVSLFFIGKIIAVSVPSRGLCFQSLQVCFLSDALLRRFRPLSGIMFSIGDFYKIKDDLQEVSVPSRGLCFQSLLVLCLINKYYSFRPLSGIMFSIKFKAGKYSVDFKCGFRPLSGIMFSILAKKLHTSPNELMFPSPLGDYVFNRIPQPQIQSIFSVSVPSRGLCFQSRRGPLRFCFGILFPSPLGDYVFNRVWNMTKKERLTSFRPLSGIMFSIRNGKNIFQRLQNSFRPLSGIMFSICKNDILPLRW